MASWSRPKRTWMPGRLDVGVDRRRPACPAAASRAATLAVVFDLPVPPRKEWTAIRMAMASSARPMRLVGRDPQLVDPPLEVLEVLGLGRSRPPAGRCRVWSISMDSSRTCCFSRSSRCLDVAGHAAEHPGHLAQGVGAPAHRRRASAGSKRSASMAMAASTTRPTCSRYSRWRSTQALLGQAGVDPGPQEGPGRRAWAGSPRPPSRCSGRRSPCPRGRRSRSPARGARAGSSFIAASTSKPSARGMRMSSRTRSKGRLRSMSSASRPSDARWRPAAPPAPGCAPGGAGSSPRRRRPAPIRPAGSSVDSH